MLGKSLKSFLVVIFILLLACSSLSLLFLIPFSHSFHKDNIKEFILNMDSSEMEQNNFFQDIIHNELNSSNLDGNHTNISEDIILELFKSKELKEVTADIISNMSDYIITGHEQEFITEEELKKLVETAIDKVNKSGKYSISEKEKEQILQQLDENAGTYLDDIKSINTLSQSLTPDEQVSLDVFRFFFSTTLKVILLVISIISFLGIVVLRWDKMKWLKINTITILITSMISILVTLLLHVINQFIFKQEIIYVFEFFNKMIKNSLILSGSICTSMILLLIIYHIFIEKKEKELAE